MRKEKWCAFIVCLCMMIGVVFTYLIRYDYFSSGCGANVGTLTDNGYYSSVRHKGICRYTPQDGTACLIRAPNYEWWEVNDFGVFYTKGRTLYVRIHETGKVRKLYTADKEQYSHVILEDTIDRDPVITLYDYDRNNEDRSILTIDHETGKVLTSTKRCHGWERTEYQAGSRKFSLVSWKEGGEWLNDLQENGVSVLPEGAVFMNARAIGEHLLIRYEIPGRFETDQMLALSGGGFLDVSGYEVLCGTNDFFLYLEEHSGEPCALYCYGITSGDNWLLRSSMDIYQAVTDGTWLYACVPWNGGRTDCWKIIYNEPGRPAGLKLNQRDMERLFF